jgi:hypothetical protein
MSKSCTYCKSVLIGYRIPHAPSACPLKAAEYCSTCFVYGHRAAECARTDAPEYRTDPIELTQPEPAATPAVNGIQVVKNEHVLAAYLRRHKIHPRGSLEDMMIQVYELAHKLKLPSTAVKFIEPQRSFKTLDA